MLAYTQAEDLLDVCYTIQSSSLKPAYNLLYLKVKPGKTMARAAKMTYDADSDAKANATIRDDNWSLLLRQVGNNRDEQAFSKLFEHFSPLIKGFCLNAASQALPPDSADEVVQEVMIKVWQKSPSYDASKSAASTWIYTVMRNCRIDLMRKGKRHQIDSDPLEADDIWDETREAQPFTYLQQSRNEDMFQESFKKLPNEQRQVLTQVYMQGKSHSEIAEQTGLPLGTVKSRVRMGLKKLQTLVKH